MSNELIKQFKKSTFSTADQNCKLKYTNRHNHLEVEVLSAEYPTLINSESVLWLASMQKGDYWPSPYGGRELFKNRLKQEIKEVEEKLNEMKFCLKALGRKQVIIKLEKGE